MNEQTLIVISRQFGSGGHEIAAKLAKRFQLPLYDKSILEDIAIEEGLDVKTLQRYDEKPRNFFTSRSVKGFSNSPEENVVEMQFRFLRERAESGESFIVLGRCGDEILKDFPNLISIFVLSDISFKKKRTMAAREGTSEDDALELMARNDRKRKYYHNQYSRGKWGDSRNYDLCINSAPLGIDGTTDLLEHYIRTRIAAYQEP